MPRLALYKGQGNLFNAVIRRWTDSQYSHCELIVGSTWFSSSVRDKGVRGKLITAQKYHWDILDLDWASDNQVMTYFTRTQGQRYGWIDLVRSQVFGIRADQAGAAFCSEWCAAALGLPNPQSYSPASLAEMAVYLSNFSNRPR